MRHNLFCLLLVSLLFIIPQSCSGGDESDGKTKADLTGIKVVMIIASQKFQDEEYQTPQVLLAQAGAGITVASSSLDESAGMLGQVKVKPDILIKDVKVKEFDAIIFVGGVGAKEYYDSKPAHDIVKEAVKETKVLAAICIAPVILAKAGVLKDKKATVFSSEKDTLEKYGALCQAKDVVQDGQIITANGPKAAEDFALTIIHELEKAKKGKEEKNSEKKGEKEEAKPE